jgi:hypothetical protein
MSAESQKRPSQIAQEQNFQCSHWIRSTYLRVTVAFLFWVIVVWFVIVIINMLNYGCIIFVGLNLKTYDFTSM